MQDWAKKIRDGDVRAIARAATAIENGHPEARSLLKDLSVGVRPSLVVGITGPPGAGKSTLVDRMARAFRETQRTVGILTVDPTSPFSGGAILGDRIRMQEHHSDPGVFIRSMATRGALGGLAKAAANMTVLLSAAGKDIILVETVGVGQDSVEIAKLAEITIVVLVPGMGDDIQAIKAGIMEIGDVFVINKADHRGVERVEREVESALALARRPDGWTPPVIRAVATDGTGIPELLAAVESYRTDHQSRRRAFVPGRISEPYAIDHLGVAVHSLDSALRFWQGQLGMAVGARESVPAEKVNVVMLPAGEPRIELLEPSEPGSVIGRFLEKRGEGLHHLALRVPDLGAVMENLRSAGAKLLNEPRRGAGGHLYVFVHPASTGGILLELIQEEEPD